MMTKPAKPRKCKVCKKPFVPASSFVTWCSPECGYQLAQDKLRKQREDASKEERRKHRIARELMKTPKKLKSEAQTAFNKFIRARDKNEPCISCGTTKQDIQYHAGHYRSVGAHPELRFNEDNCHKQCSRCNNFLSGNLVEYRAKLIKKIGLGKVESLEGPHEAKRYTPDELRAIKKEYNAKWRALEKQQNQDAA